MLEIFREIRQEIECLEEELRKIVSDADPLIKDTSIHLINAGGKRLRPAFSFLAGKFYNYDYKKVLPLAVALELIHMATLVHDDVVDSSMTRRNIPTVKAMWGNKISTHLGDYLFGKSLKLIAWYGNSEIARVLADTSVKMCEGEIQQLATANKADQTVRDYFYRIKRKTALLIAASCQLGAAACGAPESIRRPLKRYGHCIGMAFQITDDILDLVADQKKLGKPIGSDLRQGIVTLPLIYALKHSPERERLAEIVTGEEKSGEEISEACELILSCGGVEYAGRVAQKYVDNARDELKSLPDIPARRTLETVAEFISVRKF
ncbi:MAG: polyprenyl synthetase family protein [Peptococcaceae bacterium]|nr:polyprenyl synthetase family protein [Peptococcaceae bacterium]